MTFFTSDFNEFFKELAANNNKDWFDVNRKRYDKSVKEPFKSFVEELISRLRQLEPTWDVTPNQCIFRINRDIRFSKDKTPYKLNRSAIISERGKKGKDIPGIYIELNPEEVRVYGGVYMLSSDQVLRVREEIADHMDQFSSLISDKKFVKLFGEVQGEKAKRIPKELKEAAESQPLIYNKNWYFWHSMSADSILEDNFMDQVVDLYKTIKPISDFLKRPVIG